MSGVHVRVRVGDEHYALPVEDVVEVAELGVVTPVPGSRANILGVRNLRGRVIPVIDLASVLGVDASGDRARVVVAVDGDRAAGLAVDEVIDVELVAEPSEAVESELLKGAALIDGTLVGVVDVRSILAAESTEAEAQS